MHFMPQGKHLIAGTMGRTQIKNVPIFLLLLAGSGMLAKRPVTNGQGATPFEGPQNCFLELWAILHVKTRASFKRHA